MLPLPPKLSPNAALFLDLDGTLLELAPRPEAVVVPEGLSGLLQSLDKVLGGALAVVTGRPLARVDEMLRPWLAVGAGLHGNEYRWPGTTDIERMNAVPAALVARQLRERFIDEPAIEIEDKGAAVALHFRRAPERVAACEATMIEATRGRDDLRLLRGHCVIEALPAATDKGKAIARLMARAPFAGRIPAFIGDDVTDEDAFPVIGQFGGLCVKVGHRSTHAAHGLEGPAEVLHWLRSSLRSLQSGDDEYPEP